MKKFMFMVWVITAVVTFNLLHSEKDFSTKGANAYDIFVIRAKRENHIAISLLLSAGMGLIVSGGIAGIIRYFKEGK